MIKKKHCRRLHTTLIEVLIALALTAIVLMMLTLFYRDVSLVDTEIEKVKAEQFNLRYLENRLGTVLPQALSDKKGNKEFVFFSMNDEGLTLPGTQSLILMYDDGIHLKENFSNNVLGRLYVDLEGRLTLMSWPSPKRWGAGATIPRKKEILLDNVEQFSFEFFAPVKNESEANENEGEQMSLPQVRGEMAAQLWRSEFKELPALIRVNVGIKALPGKEKQSIFFIFPLLNTKSHVIYQ